MQYKQFIDMLEKKFNPFEMPFQHDEGHTVAAHSAGGECEQNQTTVPYLYHFVNPLKPN